jgi:serine/threonine-protein kinase
VTVLEIPTPDPRTFDEATRPFAEAVSARYAVKRLIGHGGMGVVYLARDRRLDRLVAIKTLPPHLAKDESVRQRFLRETRTAGAMSHPNIVPIHGADEIDGHVFFVMGYVDGESLAAHVRGMGRLEADEVRRILIDVASALGHAHERGTIHRDIKAENILIDITGRALVTDFGIARLAEAAPLTATGQMLGTVYYSSPEQVAGDPIDHRSDLYSLGVVGFLALTGRFPFDSELASAVLVAHVNKPAPTVLSINPTVPVELAEVIDRCLAKEPSDRYEDAASLVAALQAADLKRQSTPESPIRITDTEANAVWSRAASLQASTRERARPGSIRRRDAASDAAREDGLKLVEVVDAGREAGISTRFLDRALVEHGLRGNVAPIALSPRKSRWAGVPLTMTEHCDVDGQLLPEQFDRLTAILRTATQTVGETSTTANGFGWRTEWFGHQLDATVVPTKGSTTIRLTQRVSTLAATIMGLSLGAGCVAGWFAGRLAVISVRFGAPSWWLRHIALELGLTRQDSTGIGLFVMATVVFCSFLVARLLIQRSWRSHAGRLRLLTEALVATVRASTTRR